MTQLRVRWTWHRLPGWLRRLSEIGVLPSDSEEVRVRKAVLVLSSTLMASLAFVWVGTYATLGLWGVGRHSLRLSGRLGGTSTRSRAPAATGCSDAASSG